MQPEQQQSADKELRLTVLQALAAEARIAHLNLRVGVVNGIVHLTGQVPSEEIWNLAERLAAGYPWRTRRGQSHRSARRSIAWPDSQPATFPNEGSGPIT